jgi:uncharacterized protein YjbI with pentapeptide repeats
LSWADLSGANLTGSDLENARLVGSTLIMTNLENSNLSNCSVWGVSAWDLKLNGTVQSNLRISAGSGFPSITVEDIEVAQFIYLILRNEKIRNVIDTVSQKAVLILGRFTEPRMYVLNSIRQRLSLRGYVPILFDFDTAVPTPVRCSPIPETLAVQ